MKLRMAALIAACVFAPACADDLRDDDDETVPDAPGDNSGDDDSQGSDDGDGDGDESPIVTTEHGDGTYTSRVKATATDEWVYLNLEDGQVVPGDSSDWDLAFRRFAIKLNGGVSGAGDAALAMLDEGDFDAMSVAPASEYVSDEPDATDDEDDEPELAFLTLGEGWYDYNPTTHVLTAKPRVYFVRSAQGGFFKLQMLDYYDDAGTSGFPTFGWGAIAAPEEGFAAPSSSVELAQNGGIQ